MVARFVKAFRVSIIAVAVAVLAQGWFYYIKQQYNPVVYAYTNIFADLAYEKTMGKPYSAHYNAYSFRVPSAGKYFVKVWLYEGDKNPTPIAKCLEWNGGQPCFKYLGTLQFKFFDGEVLLREATIPRIHFREDSDGLVGSLGTYTSVQLQKGHLYRLEVRALKNLDELAATRPMNIMVRQQDENGIRLKLDFWVKMLGNIAIIIFCTNVAYIFCRGLFCYLRRYSK